MFHVSRTLAAVALSCLVAGCGRGGKQNEPVTPQPPADPPVAMNPAVLADFQQRVAHYVRYQRGVEKQAGARQKQTDNPAVINAKQETLAATIRATRAAARPGDIFSPEIAAEFRRLLNPEVKGPRGREVKEEMKEDFGAEGDEGRIKPVPLKVNATYPEGNPLPTVPVNVLDALPTLPPDVEYRMIGRTLILRDVDANIIVDFIPRAIR